VSVCGCRAQGQDGMRRDGRGSGKEEGRRLGYGVWGLLVYRAKNVILSRTLSHTLALTLYLGSDTS
jgi:hypothetical protein